MKTKTNTLITILTAGMAISLNALANKPSTPEEALAELRAGNERFCQGVAKQRDFLAEAKATSSEQKPFAVILSCIDSRTSSEIIFDQGMGDIFNARLAGNVADDDVLGSLEFANKAAGAKLIAVIGHSGCGAVIGAINKVEMGHLTGLLEKIEPAVDQVSAASKTSEKTAANAGFVDACIEKNVRLQMKSLVDQSSILRELASNGLIRIVGGVQDLATGRVQFLE